MVMVKTNENPVRTIPMGPLGDIRTTNMMVIGKRMGEKFSVFPTFHNTSLEPSFGPASFFDHLSDRCQRDRYIFDSRPDLKL